MEGFKNELKEKVIQELNEELNHLSTCEKKGIFDWVCCYFRIDEKLKRSRRVDREGVYNEILAQLGYAERF